MGLINDTPQSQQQPEASSGDAISQLRDRVGQLVTPDMKDAVQRIVLAGQKILYSPETHSAVEDKLKESDDPAVAAGKGVVELMGVLAHESRGTLPQKAVTPSMMILLTDILDYLKQSGRIKGDNADIERAAQSLAETMMQGSGASEGAFDQIMGRAQEAMQDPKIAAMVQQQMGGGAQQQGV